MKTKHLIIAALSTVMLAACDKPTPTVEPPVNPTPLSVVRTYNCNPQLNYVGPKPTYVYVYHSTANISFDTVEFAASSYWRLFCFASENPLVQSTYDTIHHIKLPSGNYKLLIDNIYKYASLDEGKEVDTIRWYHLHDVSVSDTAGFVIADTFFRTEFYIE